MGELYDAIFRLSSLMEPQRGRPAGDAVGRLHRRIIWHAWALNEGGEDKLEARYVLRRESGDDRLCMRRDEFAAYSSGSRSLSPARMRLVTQRHPLVGTIAGMPFAALSFRPRNLAEVQRWIRPYIGGYYEIGGVKVSGFYRFPGDPIGGPAGRGPASLEDYEGLWRRGDMYGLLSLACLFRLMHLKRQVDSQWVAACYMAMAVRDMRSDPYLSPFIGEVACATSALLRLLPDCSRPIKASMNAS
ncbi:hypothetical protein J2X02_002904 [Pseudoxanthomonas japonensis]|nr:hypothetical protein [Pseudoxanthomonas japonensis]